MTLSQAVARTTHGRLRRLAVPAATFGGLALATAALHFRDPHIDGSWGLCPSAAIFGIYCPGCGGLRAVNDLTHGDLGAAASSNLLFFVSIPLVVFLLARWGYDAWRGPDQGPDHGSDRGRTRPSAWPTIYAGLGIALVFTIARNLPMGSWLAP